MSFDATDLAIYTSTPGSSSFSLTGSNLSEFLFVVTASALPADTLTTFYIATGSTANETAQNIAAKINNTAYNFGLTITANTGSTPTILNLTSSFDSTIDPSVGFEINYLNITTFITKLFILFIINYWETNLHIFYPFLYFYIIYLYLI